jgi:starch phosphorylase
MRRHPRAPDPLSPDAMRYRLSPVREACVFTTHTPVEAGHDRFEWPLVERVLAGYVETEQVKRLAGEDALNMTRLALNLSGFVNGVAVRHAQTTTRMFPGYDIRAITNGVHLPSWVHPAVRELFDANFPSWAHEPEVMVRADQLPAERVWAAHCVAKDELLAEVRARTGVALDPALPVIGFARRMTAYKRPDLLFADLDRLRAIHARLPFQVVLAGKAHPADDAGKQAIRRLTAHARARPGDDRGLRARLRDRPGAPPGRRRRRLAEHADAAARGLGHQRHEGRAQRGAQPERARRLVAGGLDRGRHRLGDRS